MKKYMFIIRNERKMPDFRERVFKDLPEELKLTNPAKLKIHQTLERYPLLTILPLVRKDAAIISLWLKSDAALEKVRRIFGKFGVPVRGYLVDESPYIEPDRSASPGEATPGIVLLTLFRKRKGLGEREFMKIWFEEHSPFSVTVHPLKGYVRNVVRGPVDGEADPFQGIVEEYFQDRAALFNPVNMFGGPAKFLVNMLKVWRHVKTFIDLKTIENYVCREYHLIK